jgi:hypothetical protein
VLAAIGGALYLVYGELMQIKSDCVLNEPRR